MSTAPAYILPLLVCRRCRHRWHPRTPERPLRCGKCKAAKWDTPRKWSRSK